MLRLAAGAFSLDKTGFARCMMKFVASLCPELIGELEKEQEKQAAKKKRPLIVSLDGKTIRSTAKMNYYLRAHT